MQNTLYENIALNQRTQYFLYVGEIKALYLNEFLRESLSAIHGKETDYIAIVPDALETYPDENLLVINPAAAKESRELGKKVSCRIPGKQFASFVSTHPRVIELVETLTARQGELLINVFQTLPELTLDRIAGVRIIGPDCRLADTWNSKFYMYRTLQGFVPLPEFRICGSRKELLQATIELRDRWRDGIFLTLEYSAAGAFSFLTHSEQELLEKLGDWQPPYLISQFIPHEYDPTVLAVVANEKDVYIGGIADQQMVEVNKFRGSVYPSALPSDTLRGLKELTRRVGRIMGSSGYRGIFGCDYVLDTNSNIFFVEVNARKQGTTMEMCCNLEISLPKGSPNLPELEYFAVTENRFPENAVELEGNPSGIHWGTYNLKVDREVVTRKSLRQPTHEREVFRRIAAGPGNALQHIVLEHIGADFVVKPGTFLGRVISVARNHQAVCRGLDEGKRTLEETIERT